MKAALCYILLLSLLLLLSLNFSETKGIMIGAIVDYESRIGKEEKVAMEMAIEDFSNQTLALQVQDSQGKPIQATLAASHLIHTERVVAILGPRTWEETSLVAEVGSQSLTPVLSLADSAQWATQKWPFLVQASASKLAQTKAVAAIVQSWGWHRVIAIYEDIDSADGIIPHLCNSLQEVGAEISQFVALPPFVSSSLSKELDKLNSGQCRVFVVHTSLPLATHLFAMAKKMGMMEKDYVWITTDPITSLVYTVNSSVINSMQGVIGVKSSFPEPEMNSFEFNTRFTRRFSSEYPDERNHEPGIFAFEAYNTTRAVALAVAEGNKTGQDLLHKILTKLDGLSGEILSTERKLAPASTFQIINVVGRSYRELGFWTDGVGFSKIISRNAAYNNSMEMLGQVLWPGEPRSTPKGWTLSTNTKKMRVGLPNTTLFNLFQSVVYDPVTKNYTYTGFTVDLFKATTELLPYYLPFEFFPFNGTFDELVDGVYLKEFDAAIGSIAITAHRYKHVDFSHPYTDASLEMVVPVQSQMNNKAWLFVKPFSTAMWVLITFTYLYNGFVIWLIERDHCPDLRGSALNQIGTLFWLAFATLFSLQGEKLHSNLSRMATLAWLFVGLVITQSYTANLTSMLTVPLLEPTVADIETLKHNHAMVGCTQKSFVGKYLIDVLGFGSSYINKSYTNPEEIAQALRNKEIAAAFLESPWAKRFLARYCKSFVTAGPSYKVGGYAFVFPKGSLMLSDINEALVNVIDSGKLRELENTVLATESCLDVELDNHDTSLSPNSFWILFIFTGGTSTVALVIYLILNKCKFDDSSTFKHRTMWTLMTSVRESWKLHTGRVAHAETPRYPSSPDATDIFASVEMQLQQC